MSQRIGGPRNTEERNFVERMQRTGGERYGHVLLKAGVPVREGLAFPWNKSTRGPKGECKPGIYESAASKLEVRAGDWKKRAKIVEASNRSRWRAGEDVVAAVVECHADLGVVLGQARGPLGAILLDSSAQ